MDPEAPSGAGAEAVSVAVNIRPLVDHEIIEGCKPCLFVTPGEPQVGHGVHTFTYDHVFGADAQPPSKLYERCVAPLVDGLFRGYNATVFAYGQTGSGKTYTMGSAFTPGGDARGVIPSVMETIFDRVGAAQRDVDFTVRVGFVEIHKEEIHDLLGTGRGPQPVVHIREVAGGGVCLAGAAEREVHSRAEMVEVLEHGTLLRATAATGMNKQSSRSHAIFTITLEQRRLAPARSPSAAADGDSGEEEEEDEEDEAAADADNSYLCAKMHLVDLAGSERIKRTKAVGARLQEGININRGLLALGNVINALSEGKAHVPYRDSKLTRMLQDSLGGNSRTVMIACVSPADVNLEESLNTLRYANRARNIRNKPVVNRDPVAAQIAQLRQACAALRSENASLKYRLGEGGDGAVLDFNGDDVLRGAVADLEARNRQLQAANKRLRVEAEAARDDLQDTTEKMIVAQAQRDKLRQRLQALDAGAAAEADAEADAIAQGTGSEGDVVRCQLERIAELEREVKRLKQVSRLSGAFAITRRQSLGPSGSADMGSPFNLSPLGRSDAEEDVEERALCALELHDEEFVAQEQGYSASVAKMQVEMERLQADMEKKVAAMQRMAGHQALKERYDEKLHALQQQLGELQQERLDLMQKLNALQHASEDQRLRLRATYESRIKALDERVKQVKDDQQRLKHMEAMKIKAEATSKKLERDVLSIKQQKVALQRQIDKSSRDFAEYKRDRDRELLRLKKEGRLDKAQLQKLEAYQRKQQAVLRRKTEEAEQARKRLKEMEDRKSRLATSRPASAAPAAERPFTAPAPTAGPAGALPPRPPTGVERSHASASAAAAEAECQPNQMAPLLRDEKARREWVEGELQAHCESFELQKVMEGERAQRSEVQRKLREVEKALAALKSPEWWPGFTASPSAANEDRLLKQRDALLQQRDLHSQRFAQAQAKLMQARADEDAKGGVPGDARRWTGVRSVLQGRALLKTVFRVASQQKAEAMEAQAQLADLNDEIELLKLRLDIAEQEKMEAADQVAKAEVLLRQAEDQRASSSGGAASTPTRQLLPSQMLGGTPADEGLMEAQEILAQLEMLNAQPLLTLGDGGGEQAAEEEDVSDEDEEEEEWDDDEEESDDDEEEEEEEEQSDDEERHVLWDPSQATPARGPKSRRAAAAAARGEPAAQQGGGVVARRRRSSSDALLPKEEAVLAHLNEQLRKAGKALVSKPTVPLMKAALKDKVIGGQRWRAGSKKRGELLADYRRMLGLPAVAQSGAAPPPAADAQPPMAAAADAALAAAAAAGAAAGPQQQQQQHPVRSRIFEHTASSLARCAATQQALQHQGSAVLQHQVSGPLSARGVTSPTPPARSRAVSASAERAQEAGNSTPVGAEGQDTPEAPDQPPGTAALLLQSGDVSSGGGGGVRRDLHLKPLQEQFAELAMAAAAAAPAAAAAVGAAEQASPRSSKTSPRARSTSATAAAASSGRESSPLRRALSMAGWHRGVSGSPSRPPPAPRLQSVSSLSPSLSPAVSPHGSRPTSPDAPADSERQQSGSPSRLAPLFRFGSSATDGGSAGKAAAAPQQADCGAAGVSAYDLQVPPPQQQRQDKPPAPPLRSSNSATSDGSAAGSRAGSRMSSPRASDFKIGSSYSPPENDAARPSTAAVPGVRPRSGSGGAAAPPRPHTSSPRKAAWKPL